MSQIDHLTVTGNQRDDIRKLMAHIGTKNGDQAKTYLESCSWRLEQSISKFNTVHDDFWKSTRIPCDHSKENLQMINDAVEPFLGTSETFSRSGVEHRVLDQTVGLSNLLSKMSIDLSDPILLVFWYYCNVKQMTDITATEMITGFLHFNVNTIAGLTKALEAWRPLMRDHERMHPIYLQTFNMVTIDDLNAQLKIQGVPVGGRRRDNLKTKPTSIHLETDLAIEYWKLFLPLFDIEWFDKWCDFLSNEKKLASINQDQWMTMWLLMDKFNASLSDFDLETSAYPVLCDDFIEWLRIQ